MEAMETLSLRLRVGPFALRRRSPQLNNFQSVPHLVKLPAFRPTNALRSNGSLAVSSLQNATPSDTVGEDVTKIFFQERQLNSDLVSKISDMLWQRSVVHFADPETGHSEKGDQQHDHLKLGETESDDSGLLKLAKTKDWVHGYTDAPSSKKGKVKNWQDESDKRKKVNLLKYEALKRELLLLTSGIGGACSAYCLIAFSFEAAASYAFGVLFSCLYLQLLSYHSDNLSREAIPGIFLQKKIKRIGVRSEDLRNVLEKTLRGTAIALSSPRLVIPAAIYGLWAMSQHSQNDYFDFQLVPGMLGFFAYKGAALVQVYRDNEGLRIISPENEGVDNS